MIRVLVLNRFAHFMSLVFFTPCKHQKKSGFLTSILDSNAWMNLHFKIAFKFYSYLLSMDNKNNAYFGIPKILSYGNNCLEFQLLCFDDFAVFRQLYFR